MKAWVLKRLGGPLELVDLPEPEAEEGEAVLRVEAVGLNFADHLMRLGAYLTRLHPPFIPGMEVVGVVEGRRYAALVPQGGLAERVAVPVRLIGIGLLDAVVDRILDPIAIEIGRFKP